MQEKILQHHWCHSTLTPPFLRHGQGDMVSEPAPPQDHLWRWRLSPPQGSVPRVAIPCQLVAILGASPQKMVLLSNCCQTSNTLQSRQDRSGTGSVGSRVEKGGVESLLEECILQWSNSASQMVHAMLFFNTPSPIFFLRLASLKSPAKFQGDPLGGSVFSSAATVGWRIIGLGSKIVLWRRQRNKSLFQF